MSGCSHLREADRLPSGDEAGSGLNRASPKVPGVKGWVCRVTPWEVEELWRRGLIEGPGEIVLVALLGNSHERLVTKVPSGLTQHSPLPVRDLPTCSICVSPVAMRSSWS